MNIQSIKAFTDNYIWLIKTNEGNLVIDLRGFKKQLKMRMQKQHQNLNQKINSIVSNRTAHET